MEEQKLVGTEQEQDEREQQLEDSTPDIPVVRTNTPRPLSFEALMTQGGQVGQNEHIGWKYETKRPADEMLSVFPHEAPAAPPVPEEVDMQEEGTDAAVMVESTPLPLAPSMAVADATEHEFVWLFEYGMEMDAALLNSTDRLNAAALLYGPAVLKGYTLAFAVIETQRQKVVATITPSSSPDAEVWGIVYRIPRRLLEQEGDEVARLDRVHEATPPDNLYERVEVVVSEVYRGRDLPCIAYTAAHVPRIAAAEVTDTEYLQRLLEIVRKQQLPEDYRQRLTVSGMTDETIEMVQPSRPEQNTEPLPVVVEDQSASRETGSAEQVENIQHIQPAPSVPSVPTTPFPQSQATGLLVFSCFSGMVLFVALMLAVVQGLGLAGNTFTTSFAPLNVPWYVLLYGLIGGSSSCLVTLGRRYGYTARYYEQTRGDVPVFVVVIWCCRPLIGVVLAMLSYLLLNTGLFVSPGNASQHMMLSSFLAVLSGFCEGWLFKKQWI